MARILLLLILAASIAALPGCGGCVQDPIAAQQEAARKKLEEDAKRLEEERRKREAEKPDYEIGKFMTQPNDLEIVESSYKPGHWTSATLEVTATREDFHGTLVTSPQELDNMPFNLGTSRPITLAKKQKKALESTFYIPPLQRLSNSKFDVQLLARGDRMVGASSQIFKKMPDYQFYFVVLSRDPDRYSFINDLDSVRPPSGNLISANAEKYYDLLLPKIDQRTPVPTNPLCWTSIAYVLWDDLHPEKLTPEQQAAMLDWLHWGGQLILSGPGTLPLLRETFIDPYLPADPGDAWEITHGTLVNLNADWTRKVPDLRPASPWSGQKLVVRPEGRVLVDSPEGPLLVERRLGQGRIVLSAFRLGQRDLQDWKGLDGFFNACLLRRAPRIFGVSGMAEIQVQWAETRGTPPPQLQFTRLGGISRKTDDPLAINRLNPYQVSSVGFYTRDLHVPKHELDALYREPHKAAEFERTQGINPAELPRMAREAALAALRGEDTPEDAVGSGVAGWKDNNAVAQLARDALSGGIVIPDSGFVLLVLLVYLLVLVPVNFLVFRVLGHIEWAWLAVPFITIGAAVAVVRLAQLDVGFVRTQSEVGIVELHANYPRAHVTRYTCLYTSLSTTYDLRFADASALVQPLPTSTMIKNQSRTDVHFQRDLPASGDGEKWPIGLSGFAVASNTQSMLHSEHMMDVGGPIFLKQGSYTDVVNQSELDLEDAVVIGPNGVAFLGPLAAGASKRVVFQKAESDPAPREAAKELMSQPNPPIDLYVPQREKARPTARRIEAEVLNIRQLVRLAQNETPPGEIRLVAWTTDELPGLRVQPAASQSRHANVVIVRLKHTPEKPPQPDKKSRAEADAEDPTESQSPQQP